MKHKEAFLTPIRKQQSTHTKTNPRCFTCKKFPVCNIREDYLKTLSLIEKDLGHPQEDDEIKFFFSKTCGRPLPGFEGRNILDYNKYFTIESSVLSEDNKELAAAIKEVKFRNKDNVQFLFEVEEYFVVFSAIWNKEKEAYTLTEGQEVFYHLHYSLKESSIEKLQSELLVWREDIEKKENQNKELDIINTTHFSAQLNCNFYEQEKGLTEKERIQRLVKQYPCGIPMRDGRYYHLATYHIEPNKVPYCHSKDNYSTFSPMPYPVFPQTPIPHKVPIKRGDRDEY